MLGPSARALTLTQSVRNLAVEMAFWPAREARLSGSDT